MSEFPADPKSDEKSESDLARLIAHPDVRAELEAEELEIKTGKYTAIPHDEAMRVLGLDQPSIDGTSTAAL